MEGSRVNISFKPTFYGSMREGRKTTTARPKKMGEVGDWFLVFGGKFVITHVERVRLSVVCDKHYRQEGFDSPEEFKRMWESIHPHKGFDPEQIVYLHTFRRA